MNNEKIKNHINELRNKHNHLQSEINRAIYTKAPDEEVHALKKEKLRIKDEIALNEAKLAK